jgi:hypothetical protein
MKRPAEVAGLSGSVALLVCRAAGVDDPDVLVGIGAVVGAVPAAVTLLVANGGVRGVAAKLWRGRGAR